MTWSQVGKWKTGNVAHLYWNSLIFEVSRGAGLVQSELENVFAFRAQPKKQQRDVTALVEESFHSRGEKTRVEQSVHPPTGQTQNNKNNETRALKSSRTNFQENAELEICLFSFRAQPKNYALTDLVEKVFIREKY